MKRIIFICLAILLFLPAFVFSQDQPSPPEMEDFTKLGEGYLLNVPLRGGVNTDKEPALLPLGAFSMIQNMRPMHPGLRTRKGQLKLHATADGSNEVVSLFQFSKGKTAEQHFFAQMGDADVLEASAEPPAVSSGVFGSEVFNGSSGTTHVPASWSVLNDYLLYSNGSDQHQVYSGTSTHVEKFIVFKSGTTAPIIPDEGEDYSLEVADSSTAQVAILDSLGDKAVDFDCIFVMTTVPAKSFYWTVSATNSSGSTMAMNYWNGSWSGTTLTDGTSSASITLAQNGKTSFTPPTDIIPHYMFGRSGYWYQFYLTATGDLDAEVEVSEVTYDANWQSIENVWDGDSVNAIEAQYFVSSTTSYYVFGSSSVEIDSMTSGDTIFFNSADPIVGFYIDVGFKPSGTTITNSINNVWYWDGDSFETVSSLDDGSDGISKPGWVTFQRQSAVQPTQFNDSRYHSFWYAFSVSETLEDDVIIGIETMPYFDIDEVGTRGFANCAWKDRALYTFNIGPSIIYVTAKNQPLAINGSDSTFLEPGDGRSNKVVSIKNFYNEILVWQEEKGRDGGCVTLFEGYSPATFGKLVLSTKVGTLNAKSTVVVDGVLTATQTDEKLKTMAYFLSHYGVFETDGITVSSISGDIGNYFDPTRDECIRNGYEDKMWLDYDSTYNVLRLGLVSGSGATLPNIFPVYDLVDKVWSFDVLAQELSCMAEIEADSGQFPIIQVGGGIDDGTIFHLNSGTSDVSTSIDAYAHIELNYQGLELHLREVLLRMKAQTAGDCTMTPYENGIAGTAQTLSMTPVTASETLRRNRVNTNNTDSHIGLRLRNNTLGQELYLEDLGLKIYARGAR